MHTYSDKKQEYKNQSVANAVSQKKNAERTFQFVDNRPEAITTRKLQETVNNSLQAMQLKAFQYMANNRSTETAVIQRMFKKDGLTLSQGRKYVIKDANIKQLFAGLKDPAPVPKSLFKQSGTTELDIPYRDPGTGEEYTAKEHYNIYEPVVALNKNNAPQNPNDCGMYARALIEDKGSKFGYKPNITQGLKPMGEVDPGNPDSTERPNALTGEMYLIKTDDNEPERHHGATVIAEDGADHVTSEAHSSKELDTPEFAMYGSGENSFYARHQAAFYRNDKQAYMQILGK